MLNSVHPNMKFTMEEEHSNRLSFLDLSILRKDSKFISSINHKDTWTASIYHFPASARFNRKRICTKSIHQGISSMLSRETIQQVLGLLQTILKENEYRNSFIKRCSKNEISASKTVSACKKNVYICLPFKGDIVSTQIKHRLEAAIGKTYYAGNLLITYDTMRLLKESNVDKKSLHVTSNCIYQFSCICGSTYIGRTERILTTRISEHPPKNLILNRSKLPTSALGRHILYSGPVVDRNLSFKIIARMKNPQSIRFAEASAIRGIKPDLCVQKELIN